MKNKASGNVSRAVIFIASPSVQRHLSGEKILDSGVEETTDSATPVSCWCDSEPMSL
jgi:hypothetical protein